MTANTKATTNRPMMLRWIARRAGISEQHAESIWHEALTHAIENPGTTDNSAYWEAVETYVDERIEREKNAFCLSTPEISTLVRLQMRAGQVPLIAMQGWSLTWIRLLTTPYGWATTQRVG